MTTEKDRKPWCLCDPGVGPHDEGCPAALRYREQTEKERTALSDEAGLIAKYRIPLTPKRAGWLMAAVIEYPEHVITVEPPFLVLRVPS